SPSFTVVGSSSVSVSWSANGDPAGTSFLVELATNSSFAPDASSATVVSTSATFTRLTPATTYFLQVRAQNAAGVLTVASVAVSTATLAPPPGTVPTSAPVLSATALGV